MVLLIIIPFLNGYFIGNINPTFSDKPFLLQMGRAAKISYPLVNIQKAIENGPVEIVDCPMKHGGSFHSFLYVYQAG